MRKNKNSGRKIRWLLFFACLLTGLMPIKGYAAEKTEQAFILSVETEEKLIVAPEYVTYTDGQTIEQALKESGHTFTGLETGMVTAVDGVTGNFTRSDENGSYDLSASASSVKYFRFSERTDSKPGKGLQKLMMAMADYLEKDSDVKQAAKDAYDTAKAQFAGISDASAKTLAENLNTAISDYEKSLTGTKYAVTFSDGSNQYSEANYQGVLVSAQNAYGKVWKDDGDGILRLPKGTYTFCVEQDGLRIEGDMSISAAKEIAVKLPKDIWLKTDTFRLSGSYGEEDNEDSSFADEEFTLGSWSGRQVTVPVMDTFSGAIYAYAEYDSDLLTEMPAITARYNLATTETLMEKSLVFESKTSGAYDVLKKGTKGNTITYRISSTKKDGYTYSQDYTIVFERVPTISSIQVTDQDGADQAATTVFDENEAAYTYKVLDTVTAVTVRIEVPDESYVVTVNGQNAADGASVSISGETKIDVTVSSNGYENTYVLTIQPGAGKKLSFLSDKSVTVEVVNKNGVVMPYTTQKETSTQRRYQYTLVPGEQYHYVATYQEHYHMMDDFSLEDVADSTIRIDFSEMGDWLSDLSFGTNATSKYKNTIPLNQTFSAADHVYDVTYEDTEHLAYIWTSSSEEDVQIQAIYRQMFGSSLYHGKELTLDLESGATKGTLLKRFLMDENPVSNTVTIRLTKEMDGVTWYQDYPVTFSRSLTLKNLSAKCDGAASILKQEDGTTGFNPDKKEYWTTVSMAAQTMDLAFACYTENTCYGEENVGYRIKADGVDVTENGSVQVKLDGSINTQDVTFTVENDKAPDGSADYVVHILKSPPVDVTFSLQPKDALLNIYETLSGVRVWPENDGTYRLCEGSSYAYTFTQSGYVGKSGTLKVVRNDEDALVITDGDESYVVSENEAGGGKTFISWNLTKAQENSTIDTSISAQWPDFRGNSNNNGVTNAKIPITAEDGMLYWANKLGNGIDADAVGSPILVDGDLITYASDKIYRIDTVSGEVKIEKPMDHKSNFSITPPVYADGMVFVALSNGTVQAFNADTLDSLWIYKDPLGGQPNCPLTVKNGYLYTGFWNSETGEANFVCLSITDEKPDQSKESKCASWYYGCKGGFYWAGAYVSDDFVLVGTDDGENGYTSQTSRLLLLNPKTGALLDSWDGLNADIRSTVVYDEQSDAYYFTSKGGTFYSVKVKNNGDGWKITDKWSLALENGTGGVPMSTCSPVVYNGRAYVGASGSGQFSPYSGHNITVIDLNKKSIAYRANTQGYPQTSGLLTKAYGDFVYIYFFDNMTPGKLRVLRDKPGQTAADYVTMEGDRATAYALFTPTGEQAQYAICSPIVDEYGTIYFKNDSAHLMAFGNTITSLEVTKKPTKIVYAEGETFRPSGMVVTATYANGKTRDVTKYLTYSKDKLTEQDTQFTLSFPYVMYQNQENKTAMTAGVTVPTPTVTLDLIMGEVSLGDVNGDNKIDENDAQMILDYEAKLLEDDAEISLDIADVSDDGIVDSNDAVLILQYKDGKIKKFPAEKN